MPHIKPLSIFTLFLICFNLSSFAQSKNTITKQGDILSISDIHFNPFYDENLVTSLAVSSADKWDSILKLSKDTLICEDGQDANYVLFRSTMEYARKTMPKPKYIIITGDFLAHDFKNKIHRYVTDTNMQNDFINNTIRFTAWMFNRYFPSTIVLPVLGNNDSYCGDYKIAPNSTFLTMFAKAWAPLQRNNDRVKDSLFIDQFSKGGYYTFIPKSEPNHQLMMMNTIFFSSKYQNECGNGNDTEAGNMEMKWLENILETNHARGKQLKKIWIAYHIPPGVNVFGATHASYISMMWASSYNQTFIGLLNKYSTDISVNFAGHTHMDDFRVIYSTEKKPVSFVHITPSISRINGNYPAFQAVAYDMENYAITDYRTYYMDAAVIEKAKWALEYDFNQTYDLKGQNPVSLDALRLKMANPDGNVKALFTKYYDASNPAHINSVKKNWQCYWCGTGELTPGGYSQCAFGK